jgi:hypothetical protein
MLIGAGLLVGASLLSVLMIRPAMRATAPPGGPPAVEAQPVEAVPVHALRLAECPHCGLAAPQLHPDAAASTSGPAR